MHVEFRVCEVSKTCCLEPESFFRVKQLLAAHKRTKPSGDLDESVDGTANAAVSGQQKKCDLLSLYGNTPSGVAAQKLEERTFRPQLRVQFVLEQVVKMESSNLVTCRDRAQHEKQVKSKWDGSEIRTQRFSASPCEVLLASLPASVMDCVVKIRLLQLPPTLPNNGAGARLDRAIGGDEECRHDTPLCIGVTKITLKELMSVRGGVRMVLQAKRTVTTLVEELNLNTIATNAMFGKDVGGSAFLTFQVVPYAFGKVPFAKLLLFTERTAGPAGKQGNAGENADNISRQSSIGGKSLGTQTHVSSSPAARQSPEQFDTPAVRFMLIPYMAAVDTVLRAHDAISWRRPLKTLLLLSILGVVVWVDALDVALVMGGAVELFFFLRSMSIFYHTPLADSDARALVSPLTSARSSSVYLYGRQSVLLNTLVRGRLFFANGLQEDCFYEMALVLHLVRRHQRAILTRAALATLALIFVSAETLFALTLLICFVLYPVSLRIPNLRGARKKRGVSHESDTSNGASDTTDASRSALRYAITFFRRAYQLNRPMQITRVVKIAAARESPTPPPRRLTDGTLSAPALPQLGRLPSASLGGYSAAFMTSLHGRTGTTETDRDDAVSTAASYVSSAKKSQSSRGTVIAHRRAMTLDGLGYGEKPPQSLLLDGTHLLRNASKEPLSFAVVSFTCDLSAFTDAGSPLSSTASPQRGSPNAALIGRLTRHMAFARHVASSTATGMDRQNLFRRFLHETFNLLFFIHRNVTYQAYITPNSLSVKPRADELLRSDIFVRPAFLIEQGVDDSVTAALLAAPKRVGGLQLVKLPVSAGADNAARALALMAAALLQGSRLSVYSPGTTSRNGSLVVPLCPESDRIPQRSTANPCPPALFEALEEMWRNKQDTPAPGDMTISADMVLQVVSTYRSQPSGGSTLLSGTPHPNNNSLAVSGANGTVPDDPPHATTQRRSFFQSLTKNNSHPHSSGNRTPRLSQTFYGALPESRRTSGTSPVTRENSGARVSTSKRNGSGHDRSFPSSPMLSNDFRQLSMQSFEPPELKATHVGADVSSPMRGHPLTQDNVSS